MRDWNANPIVSDFIDEQADEIERLRAALTEIERIGWREGSKFKEWLVECRAIARKALEHNIGLAGERT